METMVEVRNLKKYFPVKGGFIQHTLGYVQAVDDVSFTIPKGKVLGLVEKRLRKIHGRKNNAGTYARHRGTGSYRQVDVCTAAGDTLHKLRRKMQIIFRILIPHWIKNDGI